MTDIAKMASQHPELEADDLERLHAKLEEERKRILAELRNNLQEGRSIEDREPEDLAGHASAETARDQLFQLSETEREQIRKIDDALVRFEDGTYGLCEVDGEPIDPKRLEAVPWARHCTEHAEKAEEGLLELEQPEGAAS